MSNYIFSLEPNSRKFDSAELKTISTNEWNMTCFDPQPWSIFAWIVMNLGTFFVFVFGIYLIFAIWICMDHIKTLIKLLSTTILSLFIAATIQWTIHVTSSYFCIFDFKLWFDLGLIALLCYQIGVSLLYLLFVYRLHTVFTGTVMALSQYGFISFLIGFLVQMVFASMGMFYFCLFPLQKWYYVFGAVHSFFATVLLIVFVKKICKLSDAKLLKTCIRLLMSAAIGLLSTWIPSILSFVRSVEDGEIVWSAHIMCQALHCAVALFSLCLQFPFGEKVFYKICGKLADKWESKLSNIHEIQLEMSMKSNDKDQDSKVSKESNEIASDSAQEAKTIDFVLH